jgi:hypothetical protein
MIKETSHKLRPRCTITWGQRMTPYREFSVKTPDVFTSEFSSRLEILQNAAAIVYYTLYVDGYGNVQYHPVRLINDYLVYDMIDSKYVKGKHKQVFPGVQVIGKEETMSDSAQLNIEELTTFLRLIGHPTVDVSAPSELLELVGQGIDKNLWRKFGYRRREERNAFFGTNITVPGTSVKMMDVTAQVLLMYKNAELYTRQMNIVFRPELKLAAPIFIVDTKEVFYCTSISHSVQINGDATTSVNMNFGRPEKLKSPDLFSFLLVTQKMYETNNAIPELSAFATQTEKEEYYVQNFGLNSLHFLEWVTTYDKERMANDALEWKKAEDQVNGTELSYQKEPKFTF